MSIFSTIESKVIPFAKRAPEFYKSLTAFLVSFTALEGTVAAVAASSHIAPASWVQALVAGGAFLTGFTTWWVKNKSTVESVLEHVKEFADEIEPDAPTQPTIVVTPAAPVEVPQAVIIPASTPVSDVDAAIQHYRDQHSTG